MHDVRNNTVAVASATDDERLSDPLETRLNIHGLLKVWWWVVVVVVVVSARFHRSSMSCRKLRLARQK